MIELVEGQQTFAFPDGWKVAKFDDWSFYRNQFSGLAKAILNCSSCKVVIRCQNCTSRRVAGTKGVDFVAVDSQSQCWHIEAKDYRQTLLSSFEFLADEVALKVRDTLACLVVAQLNSNMEEEREISASALKCRSHNIVLHLEQAVTNSSLQSRKSRLANVQMRLRQLVKSIDRRARVVDRSMNDSMPWTVPDN